MRLALYMPDIPQNTGTLIRTAACLGIGLDIIEPCGFVLSERHLKRAGMDYIDLADVTRHASWEHFVNWRDLQADTPRIVLMTTKAQLSYAGFNFRNNDILLMGRESAGVPDDVHHACDARITIPMAASARSINVAVSAGLVLGHAMARTDTLPVL